MKKKVKAGALQLTIFIVVVIAILLSAFLLLAYTQTQFKNNHQLLLKATELSDKGLAYAAREPIPFGESNMPIAENEYDAEISIDKSYWGIFEKVKSTATIKKRHFTKIALLGGIQTERQRDALYLANTQKPLVVVGSTLIQGIASLPERGVKPGNISGHSYSNEQLIYGSIKRSQPNLPEVQISNFLNLREEQNDQIYISLEQPQITNSFEKPTQRVFQPNPIALQFQTIKGNLIIESQKLIVVHPSAELKDIILIAPTIQIKTGVKGSFQAFATKSIEVEENVQLEYPSALVMNEKKELQHTAESPTQFIGQEKYQISLGEDSQIKGAIVYIGTQEPNNYKAQVFLEKEARVYGEVYCNKNTEVRGKVYGSVYTRQLVANQFSSIYINHLYNATIDIERLPKAYAGLVFNQRKKDIVTCLY